MVSLEAERFKITSAPERQSAVDGGRGVQTSSQISAPTVYSPPTFKTSLEERGIS